MEQLKEEDILSLWIKNFSLIIAKYEMLIDNRLPTIDRWCISGKIGNGFVDDFQYFVFTKSIKSLGSIRESTKFIYDRLKEFSKYNCKTASDELNRHMRNMFKNMRSSLKEEVGSIKKDFL